MHITVCYASETGTAEDVAFKVVARAELLKLDVEIVSIDEYNMEALPNEQMIVFVCSTTGDGEIPASMRTFWKFILRKSLPRNSLEDVNFCVFGMGDSGYDKFNAVARRLTTRMKQLSAREFISIGLGDDQGSHGYMTALDPWMDQLFSKLAPMTQSSHSPDPQTLFPSQYTITTVSNVSTDSVDKMSLEEGTDRVQLGLAQSPPLGYQTSTCAPLKGTVTVNDRLTTPTWKQNVFHIAMTLPTPLTLPPSTSASPSLSPSHVAGDVLMVYPSNAPHLVALAESYFSSQFPDPANTIIDIHYSHRKNSRKNRLLGSPSPHDTDAAQSVPSSRNLRCTVRELFTHFLGLSCVPQRGYFEELSRFVPVINDNQCTESMPEAERMKALQEELEEEREKLMELSGAEGAELYDSYCFKEQRGYLEVLTEFRTLRNGQVPLERFLELVPPLHPRHYSIASSGCKTPNEVELCVAEVSYTTLLGRSRAGVASNYLSKLLPGEHVYCYVRKGTFPAVPLEAPLLLIGPGTGVAPMRALMHERISLSTHTSPFSNRSENAASLTLLLFGCRSQSDDYLYESEWMQCVEDVNGNGRVVLNCTSEEKGLVLPPFSFSGAVEDHDNHTLVSDPTAVVVTAFSRKGHNAGRRVTHSIRTHQAAIWSLIQQENAHILVAGSASTKMPSDVRKALARVCESSGKMSASDAQEFLLRMEKRRKFCVEAWS